MNVAEICVSAYLVIGLLAATLIWTALIASRRQENHTERSTQDFLHSRPLRGQKTKPVT